VGEPVLKQRYSQTLGSVLSLGLGLGLRSRNQVLLPQELSQA
jgi:hypothetical protein